uniref:Uncharacterized protein n=1 Tax=Cacopsylla melanoneura TaxID=428564 RepID=A0A8D8U171_9HEMI
MGNIATQLCKLTRITIARLVCDSFPSVVKNICAVMILITRFLLSVNIISSLSSTTSGTSVLVMGIGTVFFQSDNFEIASVSIFCNGTFHTVTALLGFCSSYCYYSLFARNASLAASPERY